MAGNVVTTQLLVDGPVNVVVKLEGILDTSDVAATGQIGASGFTTNIGSNAIAFVAGALVPTLGQFLTFSDGVATFPNGTYIISIIDATHIRVNNVAASNNVAAAVTITGTAGAVVVVDPAFLSSIDPGYGFKASKLKINKIMYNIEDLLSVNLLWEATANTRIEQLTGRGKMYYRDFGGLVNNSGLGQTGRILFATQGWTAGATLSFSLILELQKQ